MSSKIEKARKKTVVRDSEKELKQLERQLNQLLTVNTVKYLKTDMADLHQEYVDIVKKTISKGVNVPKEVVRMYPIEFKKAQERRERYDKAWRTSFGNKTAGIDMRVRDDIGIKIKRQNGKKIQQQERREVIDSIKEIMDAFGDMGNELKQIFLDYDITVSHTGGKQPFAKSRAAGLYTPSERTVSAGWRSKVDETSMRQMAHEIAHFIDNVSAKENVGNFKKGNPHSKFSFFSGDNEESKKMIDIALQRCRQLSDEDFNTTQKMKLYDTEISVPVRKQFERIKYVLGKRWNRNEEVWARCVEQYVSEKMKRLGRSNLSSCDDDYEQEIGYWSKESWKVLEPMVETELKRRINAIKNAKITE